MFLKCVSSVIGFLLLQYFLFVSIGELVGIQYLYDQTGHELPGLDQTRNQLEKDEDDNVADDLEDEGFVEQPGMSLPGKNVELTFAAPSLPEIASTPQQNKRPILHLPSNAEYRQLAMQTAEAIIEAAVSIET
ncbi:hypothetical protein DPMN_142213 [Dreissena polymorpha]|uniref:Uncharacterized protein n=1 Tax=Dreissena polymorpha TaxID=45954 RepID=A0A9D4GE22_DREPO|nr:hypothetical protein DPMN_142213 [Dreissena polymorpha]